MSSIWTADEIARVLRARFELRNAPLPMVVEFFPDNAEADRHYRPRVRMRVSILVPDRDSGQRTCVCQEGWVTLRDMEDGNAVHIVRDAIHMLMAHEIDEAFHWDGERVFDPHRHDKAPPIKTPAEIARMFNAWTPPKP
jgi:hypothetical protein